MDLDYERRAAGITSRPVPRQRAPEFRVDRALAIRAVLARQPSAMSLSAISRRLGYPKSTTHRTLAALVAAGAIDREGQLYRLSELAMADPATAPEWPHAEVRRALAAEVGEIFARTRLTASAAVLDEDQVCYAYRIHGCETDWMPSDQTGRAPVLGTASGSALLAWNAEAAERAAVVAGLRPGERATLHEHLRQVRHAGVAVQVQRHQAILCVAAPVLDVRGLAWAAVVVRAHRTRSDLPMMVQAVRAAGRAASGTVQGVGRIRVDQLEALVAHGRPR